MVPSNHPATEELLAYTVGTADDWLATLVACHLTLCPACREEVAMLDAVGGALFDEFGDEPSLACAPVARPAVAAARPVRPNVPAEIAQYVPRPLHYHLAQAVPRYRFLAPGLAHLPLGLKGGQRPLQLVRFKPGFVVPEHGHGGLEWLMILRGEPRDKTTGQRYARGDVSRRDTQDVHTQVIGKREPCIAVFANLQAPIPHTLIGKVLARVVGL